MRKVLLIAALLLAGATASFAQFHLGGGYLGEYSSYRSKFGNERRHSADWLNGFYVGGSYNVALGGVEGLGLAPGAYFSFVGGWDYDANVYGWGFVHRTAIEIPLHITYAHDLGPGAIFGYAGPAFNVGLGYKCRLRYYYGEDEDTIKVLNLYRKGNKPGFLGTYQRFDCKFALGAGYRWEHLAAEMGWEFGLVNQYSRAVRNGYKEEGGKGSAHIHSFHFGVAYVF
ncbi:MAG: hypothetical protein IK045_08325 [Bacteroidales bacterium]|nr:hypothetical protein [Bacteroidales bacterium]